MKRVSAACFTLLLSICVPSSLFAQQSVYMLVDSIRGDQPSPHDREFKLSSFSSGVTNTVTFGSMGLTAGKAVFSPVKISMRLHPASSASFHRGVAAGSRLPSIEVRLYSSTNRIFYKTVYENAVLTNVSTEGSDEAQLQVEFVYTRVKWFASSDLAGTTPPVQIGCWDVALIRGC